MFASIKEYLNKHREIILTLLLLVIADYVLLGGALRGRLQKLADKLLGKFDRLLEDGEKKEKDDGPAKA